MTIDEALKASGFRNPLDIGSPKLAQKSIKPGEQLLFAYDGNFVVSPNNDSALRPDKVFSSAGKLTGVLAITDKRVLLVHSTLGDSFVKEIPLNQIQSVDDASRALLGTAQLRIKGLTETFVMDLNNPQRKHLAEAKSILAQAMANFGNTPTAGVTTTSGVDQLIKLKELLEGGYITREEFEREKAKIL